MAGIRLRPIRSRTAVRTFAVGFASVTLLAIAWWAFGRPRAGLPPVIAGSGRSGGRSTAAEHRGPRPTAVRLGEEQQRVIALKTEKVVLGTAHTVLRAPGRVAPDETRYAQITPRAAGVIRTVDAVLGQDVHAGDLLATVDSPEVGIARLDLYTKLQELEIARAQADWQESVFENALELARCLRENKSPEEIHKQFEHKPVGEDREKLMTAYSNYRLDEATFARKRHLYDQRIITDQPLQEVRAEYEVSLASYQALMDQMEYQTKLALTRARQALRQSETAVLVARERLRILGIRASEGAINPVEIRAEATVPATAPTAPGFPEAPTVSPPAGGPKAVSGTLPVGGAWKAIEETPASAFALRAPFDGTILDRENIVPGVRVDTTHRVFTLADLSVVWVEANVHESQFGKLAGSRGGRVRFRSSAYPEREFEGEVTYTGDLVDEKTRTVKLLARAENPERMLKPGMFVEVEILDREPKPALQIPATALLTDGDATFVYVKTGPDVFERRGVETTEADEGRVTVRTGLKSGEEIVVRGGYQLKAEALRLASSE